MSLSDTDITETDTAARFLYGTILSFIGGVLLRSFFDLGGAFVLFLFLLSASLGVLFVLLSRHPSVLLLAVAVLSFGVGVLRFDVADHGGDPSLTAFVGERVHAEGMIVAEPDERQRYTRLTVSLSRVNGSEVGQETRAIVSTDRFPRFSYGDSVQVEGTLERPENFESGAGRTFNYVQFLAKDGIYYRIPFAETSLRSEGGGNPIKRHLFTLKHAFLETAGSVIPEPQASLLGGLVVGAKQSLGNELEDAFRATGLIHIVVLSGYNVTLVAEAIGKAFSFLPALAGWFISGGAIVLFALMTGASATVVRASVMAVLVLIARATGRTYAITRALFVAALLMVLYNPMIVAFDPSFQLSFIATLGLLYVAPVVERYISFVPARWQLRSVAAATVATQLFVLPLLLFMTGQFSLVALPVNLLVLVAVPMTMLFGFLAGVFGFVSTVLSLPFAFIAYALLTYELQVVAWFNALPFAAVQLPPFSFAMVVAAYALYALLLWRIYRRNPALVQ